MYAYGMLLCDVIQHCYIFCCKLFRYHQWWYSVALSPCHTDPIRIRSGRCILNRSRSDRVGLYHLNRLRSAIEHYEPDSVYTNPIEFSVGSGRAVWHGLFTALTDISEGIWDLLYFDKDTILGLQILQWRGFIWIIIFFHLLHLKSFSSSQTVLFWVIVYNMQHLFKN